jgi:hypothetical protein
VSVKGGIWELEATLLLKENCNCENEILMIAFSNKKISTINIPLYYFISENND